MNRIRILNAVVGASVASTVLALAIGFAAMALGMARAGDYIVDLYVVFFLIGVPLGPLWFGRRDVRARLTPLERDIVTSAAMGLPRSERDAWDQQAQAIARVNRVPSGIEVKFHLKGPGRNPYLPLPLLTNRDSFSVAVLKLNFPNLEAAVEATVWCDEGRLSAITYKGDVGSLVATMDVAPRTGGR